MHRRFPVASFALRSKPSVLMPKEAGWMNQLAAGEPTAWARLMDEWSPLLYHYITANGVSETEAQALLSLLFSTVVQKVIGAPPEVNLTVLIFTLAYERMVRYAHQRVVTQRRQSPSPPIEINADPQSSHLHKTLQQFSPEVQQIALLYYLCEVKLADISQIVRQPELVVRNALNQVKRQLCR